ncbi:MAG: efflux RND transporter periplasmic adaptor subunit [Chloroflexota bacterium]|nr:MAG: efflux RND transporter periplasmic adaptor subunit [Chloroflexota bacterium]
MIRQLFRRPLLWIGLIVLVALVAIGAYFYFNQPNARAQQTAVVSRGDIKATVNANARVRAKNSVQLAFPFSGLVKLVNVKEGDDVKAGDVLAELDRTEAERRVQQAQMNLDARQDELAQAQQPPPAAELEIAQQSLKKAALALAAAEDRYKKEASDDNRIGKELAQSDYEIARANFERQTRGTSQTDLDRLQRAIENAKLDLQNAREALEETQIKAPFDGTVIEVKTRPGELMGGFNPIVTLADVGNLELLADIDEIDIAEVREGQTVELRFDAFPGETAQGQVTRLFPAASNDRGATVYHAIITLEPTELELRPGMGATLNIATIEKKNVLRVPARAIKNAGTQKIVVVKEGNNTRNVVVQTGVSDGNETEIQSGVSEGAIIVIE